MTTQTDSIQADPMGTEPSNSVLKGPWLCLLAGLVVFLLAYFTSWSMVGAAAESVLLALASIVFYDLGLTVSVLAAATATGVCLVNNRAVKGTKWECAGGWMIGLGLSSAFLFLMPALILSDRLPPEKVYQSLMAATPGEWEYQPGNGAITRHLAFSEGKNAWVLEKDCNTMDDWGTKGSPHYSLTINGKAPGSGACKQGLNVLEWQVHEAGTPNRG